MVYYSQGALKGRFVLVEFPKTLLAGFEWCLSALQKLQKYDVSFLEYFAPKNNKVPALKVPEYVNDPGFQFDLRRISKGSTPIRCSVNDVLADRDGFLTTLREQTTLDEGQAEALTHCLTSNWAFTQGPPGTGKTFLGVALVKTIIASTPTQYLRPILAVCQTNHALDSFLGDLVKDGVKIARVGGNGKDTCVGEYSLGVLSGKVRWTDEERSARGKGKHGREC
jgi:hypothetical protein